MSQAPMFEVMTSENTQSITLSDKSGYIPAEEWLIGKYEWSIPFAVLCFARKHKILPGRVQYSVRPCHV